MISLSWGRKGESRMSKLEKLVEEYNDQFSKEMLEASCIDNGVQYSAHFVEWLVEKLQGVEQ